MSPEAVGTIASSLDGLRVSQRSAKTSKPKSGGPAESWEDEADHSSDTETEAEGTSTPVRPSTSDYPQPPPPTPASPASGGIRERDDPAFPQTSLHSAFENACTGPASRSSPIDGERRPDKTTSVASRLIAAGIGQKAPKRTQEQREYDQAMKVQEKKKRDHAKAEEERKQREKEQAQKDIWGD